MIYHSKSPLRISLFGGGTDYPEYFNMNKAAVLGFSINKYIYCSAIKMHDSTKANYRISYRQMEESLKIKKIKHPIIRNMLLDNPFFLKNKWHFVSLADLPAGTGLGSSSSFSVCFFNLLNNIQKKKYSKSFTAQYAYNLERNILKENVGVQDSLMASHGGFNLFKISKSIIIKKKLILSSDTINKFNESLILIKIGNNRKASDIVNRQILDTKSGKNIMILSQMYKNAINAKSVIESPNLKDSFKILGEMMRENWTYKKSLSSNISNNRIDEVYDEIIKMGAYGGKLCGAGGNGFMFFLANKKNKKLIINKFKDKFHCTDIEIEFKGVESHNGYQ